MQKLRTPEDRASNAQLPGDARTRTPPAVYEMPFKKSAVVPTAKAGVVKPKSTPRRAATRGKTVDESYMMYNRLVLKQVHPNLCMTSAAADVLNNMSNHLVDMLVEQSGRLCKMSTRGGQTLSARHIELAVKKYYPSDLAKHTLQEMRKASTKSKN